MKTPTLRRTGYYVYGLGIIVFGLLLIFFGFAFYEAGRLFERSSFDWNTAVKMLPPLVITAALFVISIWRFRQNRKITAEVDD